MKISTVSAVLLMFACGTASAVDNPVSPRASTEDCRAEWSRSSASKSCDAGVYGRPGLTCRVEASCARPGGGRVESKYDLDYLQVRNLVNCNGRLKTGSC